MDTPQTFRAEMEINILKKKTFVTLFNSENIHLLKDVGLIPYGMYKYKNYDASIATYFNGQYPYADNLVKGLKITEVKKITGKFDLDCLIYLAQNARKIDVLNIYHIKGQSGLKALTYKIFNRKGKIYLKFDSVICKDSGINLKNIACALLLKLSDFKSTEIEEKVNSLSFSWNEKIGFVPNPYYPAYFQNYVYFNQRKNQIITVGRIGSNQKATEILIEGFAKIHNKIPEWQLVLVGPRETFDIKLDFEKFINDIYEKYDGIKDKIIFKGSITEKNILNDLYLESKIAAFPSRWEGFGIAPMEACLSGCFFVGTDIPSFRALTENFKYAYACKIEDVTDFSDKLLKACLNIDDLERKSLELREIALRKYSLQTVTDIIESGLNKQ